jgi:hypothetical protein
MDRIPAEEKQGSNARNEVSRAWSHDPAPSTFRGIGEAAARLVRDLEMRRERTRQD